MAIGSGMSGGICDIRIHDCVVRGTERGIRIKSMRGRGGYVKRINVERMQMDEIEKEAIEVSMNYGSSTAVPVSQKAPEFSEIRFAHIRGNHAAVGVSLCGLPESPLRKLTLEDVVIDAEDPLREEYVEK
ncbi:MAG: glycosyl hydrolase family 28 protein [Roseburia hominis]|uniref:glycosyl hydrolase family 28 protein n=1 Tax=Roseburia hominis TaxID=301301 RepID=UPI002906FBC4|nr:glycosyl hydrolase family 28 protein [Roseburia hominis]MDU6922411.1 glycosyl hydrolase family 28 protein [Roseburia hominis]